MTLAPDQLRKWKLARWGPMTREERFWAKVDRSAGFFECWPWLGRLMVKGYGVVTWDHVPRLAHRVAYEFAVGAIPVGLTIDHLCRIRHCVNPAHLEPVTNAENIRREYLARQGVA